MFFVEVNIFEKKKKKTKVNLSKRISFKFVYQRKTGIFSVFLVVDLTLSSKGVFYLKK